MNDKSQSGIPGAHTRAGIIICMCRQSVDSIEDAGSFHLNSNETTNNDPETSSEIALDDNKHPVSKTDF